MTISAFAEALLFTKLRWVLLILLLWSLLSVSLDAHPPVQQEWSIPVGGNAYRIDSDANGRSSRNNETLSWNKASSVYAIYFHVDRACDLNLQLEARSEKGVVKHQVSIGEKQFTTNVEGSDFAPFEIGEIQIDKAGYVRVDLKGKENSGDSFGEIKGLRIGSKTDGLKVTCVASSKDNMFYWGRRGPSVHLNYIVPRDVDLEYGYSEIMVAEGDDPIGSYFMANGFREGYFGMQVNSDQERRVLFSVWSPFKTDNPRDIPADQRIELLARGTDVKTGEFGNEGSGGQSFMIYPWKAGRTYRFLTQVKPDGKGSTVYTSWFGDKQADEWFLIASFRRPQTDTHLKGFHSFLENFNPQTGHISRRGQHQNVWVCDTQGTWHEILNARFSVDATGGGGHRLDFAGGADGGKFFLRNCGFFPESVKAGTTFTRESSASDRPKVDFGALPRK